MDSNIERKPKKIKAEILTATPDSPETTEKNEIAIEEEEDCFENGFIANEGENYNFKEDNGTPNLKKKCFERDYDDFEEIIGYLSKFEWFNSAAFQNKLLPSFSMFFIFIFLFSFIKIFDFFEFLKSFYFFFFIFVIQNV